MNSVCGLRVSRIAPVTTKTEYSTIYSAGTRREQDSTANMFLRNDRSKPTLRVFVQDTAQGVLVCFDEALILSPNNTAKTSPKPKGDENCFEKQLK
jgi:hypothetical protein